MTTVRKHYHDIGSKLHSSLFTAGAIKDALQSLVCREEDQALLLDLISNCKAVEDNLMDLERQISLAKLLTYRFLGPEASIDELSNNIIKENTAIKLLIVDDDESICNVLASSYERKGFVIAKAQDYSEALQKINEFSPDIAIIDLYLKNGKEGIDILRYVKDFLPGIKTIVMTYEDQESELRCVHELSPDELLIKPVRSQALDAKINGLIKSIRN